MEGKAEVHLPAENQLTVTPSSRHDKLALRHQSSTRRNENFF